MKITIVNEQDEIIGAKDRQDRNTGDIYRVSALWLTNPRGEILLARRAYSKTNDPGKWGPAVAGTIEEGETYEQNIVKEMFEELGLQNVPVKLGPKQMIKNTWIFFGQWYTATVDMDIQEFKPQKDEVAEIAWFSPERLRKEFHDHPEEFVASMKNLPPEFIQL